MNVNYMSADILGAPKAKPGDGMMDLAFFKRANKKRAVSILLGLNKSASHLKVSGMEYKKVQ